MNYPNKYGTEENKSNKDELINDLFVNSDPLDLVNADDIVSMPELKIDLDDVNNNAKQQASVITKKLSDYYFDRKYIENHPYVPSKIAQEVDNIRRLLKMLAINEKAQDTLISAITISGSKGTMYQSLTSLQNSMLQMQNQLNTLVSSLENIFKEMQDNCAQTFEEKDKEKTEDGSMVVRGSRDFIKNIDALMQNEPKKEEQETSV